MRDAKQEAQCDKRNRRIGEFITSLGERVFETGLDEGRLVSVRVRFPTEEEPSTLLVVRVVTQEGPRVAFVGAYNLGDALLAWRAREVGGGMRWRVDKPWKPVG